jgi:glycylpeptide N-tetradecanoyltransferase
MNDSTDDDRTVIVTSMSKPAEEKPKSDFHKFWTAQPVMRPDGDPTLDGYIDTDIPVTPPPDAPVSLPPGFTWTTIDITDEAQLTEVFNFLATHYVEDDEHTFRFMLSAPLLQWALTAPGAIPDWIIGVRAGTGVLAGFISAVPVKMRLNTDIQPWAAVNFLCVHSKLRIKHMTPVLITEIARRVRQAHIYRAVFSGDTLPSREICISHYFHRPLNLKRVHESGYYPIDSKRSSYIHQKFAVPPLVHGNCRPMAADDVPAVADLLQETSGKYQFCAEFDEEAVAHYFLPRKDILYSYVIPGAGGLQGFFSFYIMSWKVLHETAVTGPELRAAYTWYTAVAGADLKAVMADLINKAVNDAHADVANSLGVSGLSEALLAHKFETGSKLLHFYSYNYHVPKMEDSEMRFVFV